jgi:peptidoglycan/xylan/chitin deacetylase (PgdA/CDA1 family)
MSYLNCSAIYLVFLLAFCFGETQVVTHLKVTDQSVFLTLDACGGPGGRGFDSELVAFLEKEKIPATLFLSTVWITNRPSDFLRLKTNELFEIESHGFLHRPLSAKPITIYGIKSTSSAEEVRDEIALSRIQLQKDLGRPSFLYRPAALYIDPSAEAVVNKLPIYVIGFAINGDAGASFSVKQMEKSFKTLKAGDIIICHMNHPKGETAEGLMALLPKLIQKGFVFKRLDKMLEGGKFDGIPRPIL